MDGGVLLEDRRISWRLDSFYQDDVKPCNHVFFRLYPPCHGGFVRFSPRRHGVATMYLSDEGCKV